MVAEVARRRTCLAGYDDGLLKTYLDGELPEAWQEELQTHAGGCAACTDRLAHLRLDGALVQSRLAALDERVPARSDVSARPAVGTVLARARQRESWQERTVIWWHDQVAGHGLIGRPWPLAIGLAAGAVLLIGVAAAQPVVQSFAQGVLQQFRVQRVQPVQIDVAALRALPPVDRGPIEALSKTGTYTGPTEPKVRAATVVEANRATGLTLRGPTVVPVQLKGQPQVLVSEPVSFTFTYDGQKLTQVAQELGVMDATLLKELQTLNGVTVKGDVPAAAAVIYGSLSSTTGPPTARPSGTKGVGATPQPVEPALVFAQLKSPSLEVPKDVNVDRLRDALLRSGQVPPALANQLLGITDWKTTLLVPVIDGTARQVTVDGVPASLITGQGPGPTLIWQKDGALYILGGMLVAERDLLSAAASLAPLK